MICANPKCGKEFEAKITGRITKKYCCGTCSRAARYSGPIARACRVCKITFIPAVNHHRQRTCSAECYKEHIRIKGRRQAQVLRETQPILVKQRFLEWQRKNPEKVKAMKQKGYLARKPKIVEYNLRATEILADTYIKSLLRRCGVYNPQPELIEEKRLTIKLKRLINEKQRAIDPSGDHGRSHNVLSGTTGN